MTDGIAPGAKRRIISEAVGVGLAVSVVGLAFGGVAVTSGFSPIQAMVLSVFMFTGGSQFALVSGLTAGGTAVAAIGVAWLLGSRNGLYALRLRKVLPTKGPALWLGTHLVIDESTAMSVTRDDLSMARLGFWATGVSVFVGWNISTAIGAFAGSFVDDPGALGLDAVFPAAFLALIWPQLRGRASVVTACTAVALALALIPIAPRGVPVIASSLATVAGALVVRRNAIGRS